MSALERLVPTPRLLEIDTVELALPLARAWDVVRHADLGRGRIPHALFALRTLPSRLLARDRGGEIALHIDDLVSSPEKPGFQVLAEDPPHEIAVGAIGKVWRANIPFVHVPSSDAFARFDEAGYIKVAWAIQLIAVGEDATLVRFELRVDATDAAAWSRFRRYFRVIGPASRFIRRSTLAMLAREHGTPASKLDEQPLVGDELLPDAAGQVTHSVPIAAPPEAIWPWLVQMGCRRAGFYSFDLLDNAGVRSACEIHPELQALRVGDVIPATPKGDDGFEVLALEPNRALVLGGLYDAGAKRQLPFRTPRPERYWHVTWVFALEPLDERTTQLRVRARAAFPKTGRFHGAWIEPVDRFMEAAQLRHLAARIEGRMPRDDWRDVAEGVSGAAIMAAALLTPFLRSARSRWGLDVAAAERPYPGDDLVLEPTWSWTHGIEIDAPAEEVWPFVAQIGADRGGFYSYQWLENLVGCDLRNAETIHPDWTVREGGRLVLHPKMPPLPIASVAPGRWFVAHAPADEGARAAGKPWLAASWLFCVEPLGARRCRFISRYRASCSEDIATRLQFGATFLEPIGFAMDRRMLLGVKRRVERRKASAHATRTFAGGAHELAR